MSLLECDGEEHEAERAVARIQALRGAGGEVRYADFAVLYRANHQARVFEQKLRAAQIPYRVSGGQSFFDRAEIRDLVAWLRLLVNNDDDPAFLRAVATPKRGIGHQTLAALGEFAASRKVSLFDALFAPSLPSALNGQADPVAARVRPLRQRPGVPGPACRGRRGGPRAADRLADRRRLRARTCTTTRTASAWRRRAGAMCSTSSTGSCAAAKARTAQRQTVLQVAQTINVILSLAERGEEQDVVTLSTLHAAKGLEWPHVLLAGVNEGLLPFVGKDDGDGEAMTAERLQEERRLMYVGITRARRTLAVSTLRRRKRGRETLAGVPSRFIAEMKLGEAKSREDPRERLRKLRAELAARAAP